MWARERRRCVGSGSRRRWCDVVVLVGVVGVFGFVDFVVVIVDEGSDRQKEKREYQ